MLVVLGEQRVTEIEQLLYAFVGDPVVDDRMLAPAVDEAAPAETGEVVGHLRLSNAQLLDELTDRALFVPQKLEDPQSRRIAQTAEVLRYEIWRRRPLGQAERPGTRCRVVICVPADHCSSKVVGR